MNEKDSTTSQKDWNDYWRGCESSAVANSGVRDPAVADYWKQFFTQVFADRPRARIIDIGCGRGALTAVARDAARAAGAEPAYSCVDSSPFAIGEVRATLPGVDGVVADMRSIPFGNLSFDVAASQFGVEYAGEAAFAEAARLVGPGGVFASITHLSGGAIDRECADNRATAATINQSALVALAREAFAAGFDMRAGKIDRPAFDRQFLRLAPAVETAKQILRDKGDGVLGGVLAEFYRDLRHMFPRLQNYQPAEVIAWIDGMETALVAYEGRMASMTQCALDDAGVERVARVLTAAGLSVDAPRKLMLRSSGAAGAWILTARRG